MPLPDHPFTIHGGCNCRAVRYKIQVPQLSSRPVHPFSPPDHEIRLPLVTTDHCNDCRAATGSILPAWICVPADMMSVSARPAPASDPASPRIRSPDDGPWRPAMTVLRADGSGTGAPGTTLKFFGSSPQRTRTFCGHCGTNLTYAIFPMVEGFPDIFDTVLGTVDRGDLEKDWLAPERHCWWSKGVPWVQDLVRGGLRIPKHPTFKVGEIADEPDV